MNKELVQVIAQDILEANPNHDAGGKFASKGNGGGPQKELAKVAKKIVASRVVSTTDAAAKANGMSAEHNTAGSISTIHGPGAVGNWKNKVVVSHDTGQFHHVTRDSKMIGGNPSAGKIVATGHVKDLKSYLSQNPF